MRSLLRSVPRSLRTAFVVGLALWTMGATVAVAGPTISGIVETRTVNSRQAYNTAGTAVTPNANSVEVSFTVPAGRRLVIEHVSGEIAVPPGVTPVSSALHTTLNGQLQVHWVVLTNTGTLTHTRWALSDSVTMYADPGVARLFVVFDVTPANVIAQVSVSGYLD